MKKLFFGVFLGLIFILSFKLDSFADAANTFYVRGYNGTTSNPTDPRSLNFNGVSGAKYCIYISSGPNQLGGYTYYLASNVSTTIPYAYVNLDNGQTTSYNMSFTSIAGTDYYRSSSSIDAYINVTSNIPIFSSIDKISYYLGTGDNSEALNKDSLPFDTVGSSSSIPTPVVNWVLNSDGSLSRTLQFTNAQLPQNPNIRMGLQLIVHWASVDNISMSYSNQSAGLLTTGYQVFYDNAVSQDGVAMGYPLPESVSDMKPCPQSINFLTDTNSVALFNSFLSENPVSERSITYSPDGISSFANSFRTHLGDIDFEYNVPYVSCRYYYKSADGSDLNYGGWTNTYPKLPSQGAVLTVDKRTGRVIVPINDGTVNEGFDSDGNVIFDHGVDIDVPDNVDFSKVNLSLQSIMSVLGEYPGFLAFLFPYLPDWIPQLLGISLGILFVVGLFRIILK